ncbi:MAG TPA: phosphopyruvate hydratase [Bacilli bacterium]|nr:phosphopyruvate hydratase [Bacilli bacterium]
MEIKDLKAREILDSRGNPTVEVELTISDGRKVVASTPSGASTGKKEALELRDNDPKRYQGKGVLKAVNNINGVIRDNLIGAPLNQRRIDNALISIDGTPNKSYLGANATLAVSLAALKAAALANNKELYEYVSNGKVSLPLPMVNIINGGAHADNNLDIQEFMIVPIIRTFKERLRASSEIYHSLKKILKEKKFSTAVGDEGGFAPNLDSNKEALDLIIKAINEAGYTPGRQIYIALDVAASSFYLSDIDRYLFEGKKISGEKLLEYYQNLIKEYPIISIEDAFSETDINNIQKLTSIYKHKILIVGDDYFVTNKNMLQDGIDKKYCNAIIIKPNQIGTISETCDTIKLAYLNNYKMIMSHRSGETEDTAIADLVCGFNIPFIKTGSIARGERIAKYNRLLKIEENLLNQK